MVEIVTKRVPNGLEIDAFPLTVSVADTLAMLEGLLFEMGRGGDAIYGAMASSEGVVIKLPGDQMIAIPWVPHDLEADGPPGEQGVDPHG